MAARRAPDANAGPPPRERTWQRPPCPGERRRRRMSYVRKLTGRRSLRRDAKRSTTTSITEDPMSVESVSTPLRPRTTAPVSRDLLREDPAYQGYLLLRIGFTAAPILFGLDKFFNVLVNWEQVPRRLGQRPHARERA